MTPGSLPTLFISHGAPTLPLEQGVPAREFLAGLGKQYPDPEAGALHLGPLEYAPASGECGNETRDHP